MNVENYIPKCEIEAAKWGAAPAIHPEDLIFRFVIEKAFPSNKDIGIEYYFQNGNESAQKLLLLLKEICQIDGKSEIKILEFASGFGCVTRHLNNVIPFADITACDIHPLAGQFIKEKFGTDFILSSTHPEDLVVNQKFDVIFALSFFSHMPKSSFSRWIHQLSSFIKPDGFLIFTTHGLVSHKILPNGPLDEEGFSFISTSEQQDLDTSEYGLTVSAFKFIAKILFQESNCKLIYFHEAHWWGHQDVYILKQIGC